MKHLLKFKIFESKNIDNIISTLNNFCLEFSDNECEFVIHFDRIVKCDQPYNYCNPNGFYILINIDVEIYRKVKSIYLPDWFISICDEIEKYMDSEGFETSYTVTNGKSSNIIILEPYEKLYLVDMVIGELGIHFHKK